MGINESIIETTVILEVYFSGYKDPVFVNIELEDTVGDFKNRTYTVARGRSSLFHRPSVKDESSIFTYNTTVLRNDSYTLKDYGVDELSGDCIYACDPGVFNLEVKVLSEDENDECYTLRAKCSETVSSMKQDIYSKTRIPTGEQVLTTGGSELITVDNKCLAHYNIQSPPPERGREIEWETLSQTLESGLEIGNTSLWVEKKHV